MDQSELSKVRNEKIDQAMDPPSESKNLPCELAPPFAKKLAIADENDVPTALRRKQQEVLSAGQPSASASRSRSKAKTNPRHYDSADEYVPQVKDLGRPTKKANKSGKTSDLQSSPKLEEEPEEVKVKKNTTYTQQFLPRKLPTQNIQKPMSRPANSKPHSNHEHSAPPPAMAMDHNQTDPYHLVLNDHNYSAQPCLLCKKSPAKNISEKQLCTKCNSRFDSDIDRSKKQKVRHPTHHPAIQCVGERCFGCWWCRMRRYIELGYVEREKIEFEPEYKGTHWKCPICNSKNPLYRDGKLICNTCLKKFDEDTQRPCVLRKCKCEFSLSRCLACRIGLYLEFGWATLRPHDCKGASFSTSRKCAVCDLYFSWSNMCRRQCQACRKIFDKDMSDETLPQPCPLGKCLGISKCRRCRYEVYMNQKWVKIERSSTERPGPNSGTSGQRLNKQDNLSIAMANSTATLAPESTYNSTPNTAKHKTFPLNLVAQSKPSTPAFMRKPDCLEESRAAVATKSKISEEVQPTESSLTSSVSSAQSSLLLPRNARKEEENRICLDPGFDYEGWRKKNQEAESLKLQASIPRGVEVPELEEVLENTGSHSDKTSKTLGEDSDDENLSEGGYETDDEAAEDGESETEKTFNNDGFEAHNKREIMNFEEQVPEEVVSREEDVNDVKIEIDSGSEDNAPQQENNEDTESAQRELFVVEVIQNARHYEITTPKRTTESSKPISTATDSQYLLLLEKSTPKETLENLEKLKSKDLSCMKTIDTVIKVFGETVIQKQFLEGVRSIRDLLMSRRDIAAQLPLLADELNSADTELRRNREKHAKCQEEIKRLAASLGVFRPKDVEDVTKKELKTKLTEKRTWWNKVDKLEGTLRKSTEEWNKHLDNLEELRIKLNGEMTTHKIIHKNWMTLMVLVSTRTKDLRSDDEIGKEPTYQLKNELLTMLMGNPMLNHSDLPTNLQQLVQCVPGVDDLSVLRNTPNEPLFQDRKDRSLEKLFEVIDKEICSVPIIDALIQLAVTNEFHLSLRDALEEEKSLRNDRVRINNDLIFHAQEIEKGDLRKSKEIWKSTATEWKNKSDAIKKQEQLFYELIKNYSRTKFDLAHLKVKRFYERISSYNDLPTDLLQDNRKRAGSPIYSNCKMARREDAKEAKKVNQPGTSSQVP